MRWRTDYCVGIGPKRLQRGMGYQSQDDQPPQGLNALAQRAIPQCDPRLIYR